MRFPDTLVRAGVYSVRFLESAYPAGAELSGARRHERTEARSRLRFNANTTGKDGSLPRIVSERSARQQFLARQLCIKRGFPRNETNAFS